MPLELVYLWTIGLLVVVALLYVWLRLRNRRHDDASPVAIFDVQMPERVVSLVGRILSPAADSAGAEVDAVGASAVTEGAVTEEVATEAAAAETAAAETVAAETVVSETMVADAWRWWVLATLAGGLLLVWLGQVVYKVVPLPGRWWVFGLMGVGAAAFLLAGQTAARQQAPHWLVRPAQRLARFLGVSAGQVVLLLLAPCFVVMATLAAGDQMMARQWPVSVAAWLLAIGLAVAGSWQGGWPGLKIGRTELLFTGVVFLAALLLRGVATAQIPTTFSGDEGSAGLSALNFVEGRANNLFTIGWFSFPSLYFAVQSVGIRLMGQSIEALRVVSALAGALAVVATYWLARSLFDRTMAAVAAVYLAASHYHIHFSRIGLNNIWDSFFGMLAMLGLWYGWKSGQRAGFVLCGLALGLGQYFYVSIRALPLLFLVWAGVALWRQRPTWRQRLPGLIVAAFIALIVVLPLAHFFVQHPDEFNAPMNRVTLLGERLALEAQLQGQSPAQIVGSQITRAALGFTHEPLRMWYNPGAALLLPGAAALFWLGVLWALVHFDLRYLLLFLPLLGVIASNSLSQDAPAAQRYVMAAPVAAILVAVPLGQAAQWLRQLWPQYQRTVAALTAVVIVAVALADLRYYFFEVYDEYVLGGFNTETATEIAYYLRDEKPGIERVYFFGFPRMGYFSHSTIPFLVPRVAAEDVVEPLAAPPNWPVNEPTLFIFLPERVGELEYVRTVYPGGGYREFYSERGQFLFAAYGVEP